MDSAAKVLEDVNRLMLEYEELESDIQVSLFLYLLLDLWRT